MSMPKKPAKSRSANDCASLKPENKQPVNSNVFLYSLIGGGVVVFLVGGIATVVLGYAFWPSKGGSAADVDAGAKVVTPELASFKADYVLSGKDLEKELDSDAKAAHQKYRGKTLEITAYVSGVIGQDFALRATPTNSGPAVAFCNIPHKDAEKTKGLSLRQNLKVLGIPRPGTSGGNLVLDVIAFTELEPSTLIVTTGADFAKEFEQDAKAARKKYEKAGDFVIRGRIKEYSEAEGFGCLKVVGTPKITLTTHPGMPPDQFKGKESVEFRASILEVADAPDANNEVKLRWWFLISAK